jgi:hypothetical protein
MKSIKSRPIIIKDPRLRQLRSNLRKILQLAVDKERGRSDLDPRERSDLRAAYDKSILICNSCGKDSTDLDMAWVSWMGFWVCQNCYENHYKNVVYEEYAQFLMETDDSFHPLNVFLDEELKELKKLKKYFDH